ncbi:unnamed protein product [Diamesa serratosioi]
MGNSASTESSSYPIKSIESSSAAKSVEKKPACKACCACPETKKPRDACIVENGEENCGDLIEKHKQCMRDMGFKI